MIWEKGDLVGRTGPELALQGISACSMMLCCGYGEWVFETLLTFSELNNEQEEGQPDHINLDPVTQYSAAIRRSLQDSFRSVNISSVFVPPFQYL